MKRMSFFIGVIFCLFLSSCCLIKKGVYESVVDKQGRGNDYRSTATLTVSQKNIMELSSTDEGAVVKQGMIYRKSRKKIYYTTDGTNKVLEMNYGKRTKMFDCFIIREDGNKYYEMTYIRKRMMSNIYRNGLISF